jgi:MFS family permease
LQAQFPTLLDARPDDTTWVITATLLGSAVSTPIAGRLGDLYGKRRIMAVLLVLLSVGSVICALSTSLVPMVVGRGLQGTSLGVVPLGIAVLRDVVPAKQLGSAVGIVSATLGGGAALGLPLGAVIVAVLDWHWIFWLSTAFAVASLLIVLAFVPRSEWRTEGTLDVLGAMGLALGLTCALLAISKGNAWGWNSVPTLGLAVGAVIVLLAWGRFELRKPSPLVDLRVVARPAVLFTNLASIAMSFSLFSSNVTVPQMLELPLGIGLGQTVLVAGLVLMPSGLMMMAISPFSGVLADRFGPRRVLMAGACFIIVSYGQLLLLHSEIWHFVLSMTIAGVGIGLGYASLPTLIMRAVPAGETGAANSINALMRSLGTTLASAVAGAVLASLTRQVGGALVPSADAFQVSFAIALGAGAVCLLFATLIPRNAPGAVVS